MDSSRVGDKMTANADLEVELLPEEALPPSPRAATRRSSTGAKNATVLPPNMQIMSHT